MKKIIITCAIALIGLNSEAQTINTKLNSSHLKDSVYLEVSIEKNKNIILTYSGASKDGVAIPIVVENISPYISEVRKNLKINKLVLIPKNLITGLNSSFMPKVNVDNTINLSYTISDVEKLSVEKIKLQGEDLNVEDEYGNVSMINQSVSIDLPKVDSFIIANTIVLEYGKEVVIPIKNQVIHDKKSFDNEYNLRFKITKLNN